MEPSHSNDSSPGHASLVANPSPRWLEVIDRFEDRVDLAKRRETKYALPCGDVAKLRRVLAGSCRAVVHNRPVSMVRSVYFDDARLSACYANISGLAHRRKVRTRWYDSLLPHHDMVLEIKWRDNRISGKHRLQLRSQRSLVEMSYREIQAELAREVPPEFLPSIVRYPDPTVLVEYKREHFVSRDGRIRLTIDYDLMFYDQTGRRSMYARFGQPLNDLVVVEGKTPVGAEAELKDLLFPFAARVNRCSKYVHGCRVLGLIGPNE